MKKSHWAAILCIIGVSVAATAQDANPPKNKSGVKNKSTKTPSQPRKPLPPVALPGTETRPSQSFIQKIKPTEVLGVIGYGFLRYDMADISDGSKGILVSKIYSTAEITASKHLNPKWEGVVFGDYSFVLMDAPTGISYNKPGRSLFGFGLGGLYHLNPDRLVNFNLAAKEELYPRAASTVLVNTDTALTYEARGGITYDLATVYSGVLSLKGETGINLPAKLPGYTSKIGYGLTGVLGWSRKINGKKILDGSFSYGYWEKDTGLFTTAQQELMLRVGLTWLL